MPVPTLISELSTTPGSNSPAGSDAPSVIDDHLRTAYSFIRTLSDEKSAITDTVLLTGNQSIAGTKTFSSAIAGSVTGTAANITGTAAIANGGTGQTTAAAAFSALKQAATDSATGVVELATSAEVQTGTDTARAITPAGLAASVQGFGQTQTDVTGSRAFATTYTNSTGRPIQISVRVLQNSGAASSQAALTVSGVVVAWSTTIAANFLVTSGITYSIPNGATYSVSVISGAMLLSSWIEQR